MKSLPVEQSIGMILAHDMTEIIPGESKEAVFKKGHIIQQEDIQRLLNMGKEHIYVIEYKGNDIHENEAAVRMAKAAAGDGFKFSEPSEGKVNLIVDKPGFLKINSKALYQINNIEEVMMATLSTDRLVEKYTVAAGTRIIPLLIDKEKIEAVEKICSDNYPLIQVKPLRKMKVGIVTTGNEVFYKRIPDKFGPVIVNKFNKLGCEVIGQLFSRDNSDMIADSIKNLVNSGAEIITVTGGMSVDPDDVTPLGIRKTGAEVITYGAPVLPGAMFLMSYLNDVPVIGLPGCVMYNKITIFDLIVPRILAGEKIKREEIVKLGLGGLCAGCDECRYPNCGFGKGGQ